MTKKWIALLVAMALAFTLLAGCSGAGNTDADDDDQETSAEVSETTGEVSAEVSEEVPVTSGAVSTGNPVSDSLTAYMNAKSVVYGKLSDGLSNNPDTLMLSLSLAGVGLVDINFMMAAFFGAGEEAVTAGLSYLGVTDVQYSENGSDYALSYKDKDGIVWSMTGSWDAANDSLACVGAKEGVEYFYGEYHKTAYGYIAQYYLPDNTTQNLYVVAVEGEDGTFGLSTVSAMPAALTGNEAADYPTSCDEWYAVHGTTITGKTSDGTTLDFEYTPTPSAT